MLDVKGNFPGGLENILCSYTVTQACTQIHIMQECLHFIDLIRELDLTKLDENQNLEFKKEANILRQITDYYRNFLYILPSHMVRIYPIILRAALCYSPF